MKKFKSLMLAALASAALAAPSFAEGHGSNLVMTGEVIVGMKQTSNTPDSGDTTTVQSTYIGDVNAKLSSQVTENAAYAVEFLKDDEGAGKVSFEMTGTATSGDNSIKAFADLSDITGVMGYGDVYIQGGNKTLTVKVGQFGSSENYKGGMENFTATVDNAPTVATNPALNKGSEFTDEHLVITGFRGIQGNLDAGSVSIELAIPWMSATEGDYALSSNTATTAQMCDGAGVKTVYSASAPNTTTGVNAVTGETLVCAGGTVDAVDPVTGKAAKPGYAKVATNITGARPVIKFSAGAVDLMAMAYTLSFTSQAGGTTQTKSDSGAQLMASIATGAATINLGYTSRTHEDLGVTLSPNVLNGNVVVALGGAQSVGASFEVVNDGAEKDETTATRFSASYNTPFFVENVTMKLGVGTATQSSDIKANAGSANALGASWNYAF